MYPAGLDEAVLLDHNNRPVVDDVMCVCSLDNNDAETSFYCRPGRAQFFHSFILVSFTFGGEPRIFPLQEVEKITLRPEYLLFTTVRIEIGFWSELSISGYFPVGARRQVCAHWAAARWKYLTKRRGGRPKRTGTASEQPLCSASTEELSQAQNSWFAKIRDHFRNWFPGSNKTGLVQHAPKLFFMAYGLCKVYTHLSLHILRSLYLVAALIFVALRTIVKGVVHAIKLLRKKETHTVKTSAQAVEAVPEEELKSPHDKTPASESVESLRSSAIRTAASAVYTPRDLHRRGSKDGAEKDAEYSQRRLQILYEAELSARKNSVQGEMRHPSSVTTLQPASNEALSVNSSPRADSGAIHALGMLLLKLKPALAANYLDKGGKAPEGGMLVIEVHEASRAKAAGLAAGDLITSIDGTSVYSTKDVKRLSARSGNVDIKILRPDGSSRHLEMPPIYS